MSPERIEEELFGSETDGVMRPGLLEHAHGGTLFLDEIADMPPTTQGKILRVLTDQSYHAHRRPATREGRCARAFGDIAQPAGRNCCRALPGRPLLSAECRSGSFATSTRAARGHSRAREPLPCAIFAAERRMPPPGISEEAMAALQAHDWPGNIRQLRNIIERTLILAPGDRSACIEVDLLPPEILDSQHSVGGASTAMAIMGSPLREARNCSSANICASRSAVFPATSRAPRRSSAWNAQRCIGS